ncbi:DUF4811 domain-containing protein [Lactobacillaceae bacterium L1_55_11]|nr:DUF4811 domain-containing protein [Lactobacillaceae bacterium L1_55_11]
MIIVILVIFTILAFLALMMIKPMVWRVLGTVIGLLGMVASVALITANMHDHYGMKTVTTTTTRQIYSATNSQGYGVLLYQNLGTDGQEKIYIYRDQTTSNKPKAVTPDLNMISSQKTIDGDKAYRKDTKTSYVYKNSFYKFLFGIADNNHETKSQRVVYEIPDTWIVLSTQQAKTLQAKLTPKTDEEKQAFAEQQQEFQATAQSDPDEAARNQVDNIKSILGI